jgi:hypothetical protein
MKAASYSLTRAVLFKLQILSGFSEGPELLTGGASVNIELHAVRNWPDHRGVPVLAFCPFQESVLKRWEIWSCCRKREKRSVKTRNEVAEGSGKSGEAEESYTWRLSKRANVAKIDWQLIVTGIRVEKCCRQENWLEKERRLSVIREPYW